MRRALLALALLGALALPGCLEPFRVRVEADVLDEAPGWTETYGKVKGGGLGARTQETRYSFEPDSSNPPFPGTLQVFSVRSLSRLSSDELLRLAQSAVEDGAGSHAIVLDGEPVEGRRTLASSVHTHWVLRSGTTTQAGQVFDDEVRIRILAEVGHDGRSDTSFLAIAIVQVERTRQCPLLAACQPTHSEASWIQVVGDPEGSVQGATSTSGFIDHLVTR
ncbi:MAG: hypothetical protein AABY18_08730 [Candidatus Thermoplasmatota archaeon]